LLTSILHDVLPALVYLGQQSGVTAHSWSITVWEVLFNTENESVMYA